MREDKERLEREAVVLRREGETALSEKRALDEKVSLLLTERDSIQLKVEAMLEAITSIDTDVAEAVGR